MVSDHDWMVCPLPIAAMPALATTTSRCPSSFTPSSIAFHTGVRSCTSTIAVCTGTPSFSTSRAVSSRSSGRASGYVLPSRSAQMSSAMMPAPSAAKLTACERPWPRAAPEITATLLSSFPTTVAFPVFVACGIRWSWFPGTAGNLRCRTAGRCRCSCTRRTARRRRRTFRR